MQNTWLAFLYTLAPLFPDFQTSLLLVKLEDEKCLLLSPFLRSSCIFMRPLQSELLKYHEMLSVEHRTLLETS